MKRLFVFDLDGTLALSKSRVDPEMAALLNELLARAQVAVISGGGWPQFEKQLVSGLASDAQLSKLSLLPTCGTKFVQYRDAWSELYSEDLSEAQKASIVDALNHALDATGYRPQTHWGPLIEDRGSQITLSALGQSAPLEAKDEWDPDFTKRKALKRILDAAIPDFSIRLGGSTSIDITKPGIDKGYGIRKLRDVLKIGLNEMLFMGDAIFPGGNDYAAKEAGVDCIKVRDVEETKRVVEAIVACL